MTLPPTALDPVISQILDINLSQRGRVNCRANVSASSGSQKRRRHQPSAICDWLNAPSLFTVQVSSHKEAIEFATLISHQCTKIIINCGLALSERATLFGLGICPL